MDKLVITECYVDSNLIETLVPSTIGYNKQNGCSNVAKVMKERLKNSFAVGIIDKDRKDIDYLQEFDIIDEVNGFLKLWKHKSKHQYIIQIVPAIERWILNVCGELDVKLKQEYSLPDSFNELCKYSKNKTSKNDTVLKKLFAHLGKQEHDAIVKLKHWVSYLRDKNYKADIKELTNV